MTMSDQIIAVLDNLCAKFGIAIDWTSENVLPYVMELAGKFIKYEIVTSIVWCFIIAMLAFISYKFCRYCWKKYEEEDDYGWEMGAMFAITAFVFLIIATIAIISCQIFDIVTCITFPEKAIFEYVSYMMKTV